MTSHPDTSDRQQLLIYRQMTPAARVRTACDLHDFAHQRLVLQMSRRYPDRSRREILVTVARRFLGDAAAIL
ncbi:hypothetical protein HQ590_15460 [bacterium]|nr:hypothetical protein [bacterium]